MPATAAAVDPRIAIFGAREPADRSLAASWPNPSMGTGRRPQAQHPVGVGPAECPGGKPAAQATRSSRCSNHLRAPGLLTCGC
eukprot:4352394-Alexandrium_andersonii.AAC.1